MIQGAAQRKRGGGDGISCNADETGLVHIWTDGYSAELYS